MAVNRWKSTKFAVRAVIGDTEIPDVAMFRCTYELNSIPMAELVLSVGRNIRTLKPATVHTLFNRLSTKTPAKVYMRAIPLAKSSGTLNTWPKGEFLVFDGYAVGIGLVRTREMIGFSVGLLHWLSDLDSASSISATSHPHNPADFTLASVTPQTGANSAGGAVGWIPVATETQNEVTSVQIEQDFWLKVLHPWMVEVAGRDLIDVQKLSAGVNPSNNAAAKAALSRMGDGAGGKSYVPLAMDLGGANGLTISNAIIEAVQQETYQSWVNTTLWAKLIGEWAPSYGLSVVPRIEDAVVIPFVGGLKSEYTTIKSEDIGSVRLNGTMPRVLRALGIFHGAMMDTGGALDIAEAPLSFDRLGGIFPDDWEKGDASGMIMLKGPPPWLAQATNAGMYSRSTTGAEATGPIANALAPAAGIAPPANIGKPADNAKGITGKGELLDRFAHQLFVMEMLKARVGELSGPVRFDVAPGSSVKVESGIDVHMGTADQLAQAFHANVLRVTTEINAENGTAGTSFTLDHIRTAQENKDPDEKMAVERPPLYKQPWKGAGMSSKFTA